MTQVTANEATSSSPISAPAVQSLIQIIKVNELRSGVSSKNGRPWQMQDAECLLMSDDGTPMSVGVLQLPKHLMGDNAPTIGMYQAGFGLRAGMTDRKIEAVLVSLNPVKRRQ